MVRRMAYEKLKEKRILHELPCGLQPILQFVRRRIRFYEYLNKKFTYNGSSLLHLQRLIPTLKCQNCHRLLFYLFLESAKTAELTEFSTVMKNSKSNQRFRVGPIKVLYQLKNFGRIVKIDHCKEKFVGKLWWIAPWLRDDLILVVCWPFWRL